MMFNPIVASENIKESFVDYITTSFDFQDETYARELREELNKPGMIAKGPYIELSGSYETTKSIHQLITEGVASPLFDQLEPCPEKDKEIPLDRPLYAHQVKALERAMDHKNLVVTTGTGSGKTECFLIPIVNSLLREIEAGTLSNAVRAIVIYPMNALANDQIERMRDLLKGYPQIRFGLYNGNTEYTEPEARSQYHRIYGMEPSPNEVISREKMQSNPPHILITNYSMLEYMMLRPNDDKVFTGAKLRFIVLDEAHIYKGATGMETALLMRRLRARIDAAQNVQYILTSATLGGKDADAQIVSFAQHLCGVNFTPDNIIRASVRTPDMKAFDSFPMEAFHEIASNKYTPGEVLQKYGMDYAPDAADEEKLFELCLHSKLFHSIRSLIQSNGPMTVSELYQAAVKDNELTSQQDLIDFIDVCSRAEKDKASLIKARYHFFVRALEGAYITLTDPKRLFLQRKKKLTVGDQDIAVFECAVCSHCGRTAVVVTPDDDTLPQVQKQWDNAEYYILKENEAEELTDEDGTEEDAKGVGKGENDYVLCPVCARIDTAMNVQLEGLCEHDRSKYLYVTKCPLSKASESPSAKCIACGFGQLRKFYLGSEAATAVLGTELYEQLPEKEQKAIPLEERVVSSGIFGKSKTQTSETVSKARQFLCFSDSRSEAAFFASYMEKSYEEFLRRRGIWHVAEELKHEGQTNVPVSEFVKRLTVYFENCGTFKEWNKQQEPSSASDCKRNAWIAILNEMFNARRSSSLASMGLLSFEFAKNEDMERAADAYGISALDMKQLLNLLVLDAVYSGSLNEKEANLSPADHEYIFYSMAEKQLKLVKTAEESKKSWIIGWMARARGENGYYYNGRQERVKRALNLSAEKANDFLKNYWLFLTDGNEGDNYIFEASDFNIRLNGDPNLKFYRCKKCGKITAHNCLNHCASVKCSGMLEPYDPAEKLATNHYAKLYQSENMKPLYIKEHTAQLSRDQQTTYQKAFVDKKLNALSCSTTFEMGVDVGSLETVYMRDVPPSPANYVQRAGRAGRSKDSAAFVMTYAKLSSHDFTFYQHPTDMISGKIKAPVFELENKKVVYRHIYAVALADFFADHQEVYNSNNATVFLNKNGYEQFKTYLQEKPERLLQRLKKSIPENIHAMMGIDTWEWVEHLIGEDGVLSIAVNDYLDTLKEYEKKLKEYSDNNKFEEAGKCNSQLRRFRMAEEDNAGKRNLIEFLVRSNVLPKYGFPVDTVEMLTRIAVGGNGDKDLRLIRDLQMAVAEYAPGSQVVADGKMYTSRYIRKLPKKDDNSWEIGHFSICPNQDCKQENFTKEDVSQGRECVSCHKKIPKNAWKQTLEPRMGFIADLKTEEVPMKRPEREYKSEDYYVGDTSRNQIGKWVFEANGHKVEVESTTNDTLAVIVKAEYAVCQVCGYATEGTAEFKIPHKTAFGYNCKCSKKPTKTFYLSHDFKTDVAKLTFMNAAASDYNRMLSVMYALLEGVSRQLGIERTDIKGTLFREVKGGYQIYSIVLYDAVAGGAGHVRRLVTDDGKVLNTVIEKAIAICEGCDCDGSCYKCLRNYYNQKYHKQIDRMEAATFLKEWQNLVTATNTESSADMLGMSNSEQQGSTCQKGSRALVIPEYPEYDRMTSSEALAELADPGNGLSEETNEKLQRIIDMIAEDGKKNACMDIEMPLNNGGSVRPDIIWPQQKVALFTAADQYEQLSEYDWTSFLLDEHFVPEELLQCINEKE